MVYPSLSPRDAQILHSILYGPSGGASVKHQGSARPIIEKLTDKYWRYFNGDAAEIQSICFEAALDIVIRYSAKPEGEIYKLAVRTMVNRILNASKALSRKKRGGGVVHVQIDQFDSRFDEDDPSMRQVYHRQAVMQEGSVVDKQASPIEKAIARQEIEREFGGIERAIRRVVPPSRRRKLLS